MKRIIVALLKSFTSLLIIGFETAVINFDEFITTSINPVLPLLAFIVISLMFYFFSIHKISIETKIASTILSIFLGINYSYNNFETIIFVNKIYYLFIAIYIFGWQLILSNVIEYIRKLVVMLQNIKDTKFDKLINKISNTKFIILITLFIFICWIPYIIIRYPAGLEYDAMHQLLQYFGYERLTNHWPVFSTYLMGSIANIGKTIFGDYESGVFFLTIVQSIFSAFTFSYTTLYGRKHELSNVLTLLIICAYAFVPIFPGYFTSIVKDVPYSLAILWLIIIITKLVTDNKHINIASLFFISLFTCLLRNEGKYVLSFMLIYSLFVFISNKEKSYLYVSIVFITNILLSSCYSNILLPYLGIKQTSIAEALSIPFQQTARYINAYENELTEEEIKTISSVLDIKTLKEDYNPLLSDPVKATYRGDNKELINYLSTWFKMFFKHPIVYVDATLNNSYGFLYSTKKVASGVNSGVYNFKLEAEDSEGNILSLYSFEKDEAYEKLLKNIVKKIENIPVIGQTCNIGLYVNVTILLFIIALKYKKNLFMLFIPSVACLLVCIASPTWWWNGFRYALPIVACMPYLLINIVASNMENNG